MGRQNGPCRLDFGLVPFLYSELFSVFYFLRYIKKTRLKQIEKYKKKKKQRKREEENVLSDMISQASPSRTRIH